MHTLDDFNIVGSDYQPIPQTRAGNLSVFSPTPPPLACPSSQTCIIISLVTISLQNSNPCLSPPFSPKVYLKSYYISPWPWQGYPLAKRIIIQILPTHFHAHANLANLNTISRYHKIFPSDAPIVLVTINNQGDCYPPIPASLHRPSSYQTYLTLVMTGIYCRYSCHGSQSLNYITAFHAKTTFYV